MFEVGKSYKTIGGHKATVIHREKEAVDGGYLLVVVHT